MPCTCRGPTGCPRTWQEWCHLGTQCMPPCLQQTRSAGEVVEVPTAAGSQWQHATSTTDIRLSNTCSSPVRGACRFRLHGWHFRGSAGVRVAPDQEDTVPTSQASISEAPTQVVVLLPSVAHCRPLTAVSPARVVLAL